jgi:hypothetical protein
MLPYVPDTTSWDVANEVARRRRGQIAAAAVQLKALGGYRSGDHRAVVSTTKSQTKIIGRATSTVPL